MKEYIISILSAGIVFSVFDLLMPRDSFAKYARFVCGVMLAGLMLEPLIKLYR